jgi:capsular polysaccharide transport system permease protein
MRELHTRYGRENIGYLWLILEPFIFGSIIAVLHAGEKSGHGDIDPVAFSVTGYSVFIIFRGIVNRSEGALEANRPLLHHRMVTVLDICLSRALLELAGCLCALIILIVIAIALGYMEPPARPLYLALGIFYVFWISTIVGLIVTGGTYERTVLGRLVHPCTYFIMPLSGAFYRMVWLPQPYRDYVGWFPLTHMFEMVRYGEFSSATMDYVDIPYITYVCLGLTLLGLVLVRTVRDRIHVD